MRKRVINLGNGILALSVKSNKHSFEPKEKIKLTVALMNAGNIDLKNVSLTMVLPSYIKLISVKPKIESATSGNTTLFGVDTITKQKKTKLLILCQVDKNIKKEMMTDIEFSAVSDDTRKVTAEINFMVKGVTAIILAQPVLVMSTKLYPRVFKDTLHVAFTIKNQGEKDADNAVLTIQLPPAPRLKAVKKRGIDFSICGNTVLYCLGTIKSNDIRKLDLEFKVENKEVRNANVCLRATVQADGSSRVETDFDSNARYFIQNRILHFGIVNTQQEILIPFEPHIDTPEPVYSLKQPVDRELFVHCLIINYDGQSQHEIHVYDATNWDHEDENLLIPIPMKPINFVSGEFISSIHFLVPQTCTKVLLRFNDIDKGKLAEIEVAID